MQFSVLHYHFRSGGVRRVIEQGLPALMRAAGGVTRVVMAAGEAPDAAWRQLMESALFPCAVEWIVEPALGYWSEQQSSAADVRSAIRDAFRRILTPDGILWAHNLSVGRNLLLSGEITAAADTGTALWLHHHDWWWEGRWERWPEMLAQGLTSLEEAVALTFFPGDRVRHFCVNESDARRLRKWTGVDVCFMPNPIATELPDTGETERAREFLHRITGGKAAWIYPCRALRRKNIAEALLVQRWLAPEAATATTGGPSSAGEQPYFETLKGTASRNGWPLHMAVCTSPGTPTVPSLMAAADTVTVTSLREGFGLVYHEAAAACRPLLARIPMGAGRTLESLGFRFRSGWRKIRIPLHLYDKAGEGLRVTAARDRLRALLPACFHAELDRPTLDVHAADFGGLTLQAQLEVLSHSSEMTRKDCLPWNTILSHRPSPQPPARKALSPAQWAEAMLRHARNPPSSEGYLPDWLQHTTRFLVLPVLEWLQYPLLWPTGISPLL